MTYERQYEDIQQSFLNTFDKFAKQLNDLTEDMKALEVVTAVGKTIHDDN